MLDELAKFSAFGKQTAIEEISHPGGSVPVYINEFWTAKQRDAHRLHEISYRACFKPQLPRFFIERLTKPNDVVFDPFMGSGTTLGEALKLGARAIGRDINPVSYFAVRNALGIHPRSKVLSTFREMERDTAPSIREWYRSRLADGAEVQTLYYFWVKELPCPVCGRPVCVPRGRCSEGAVRSRWGSGSTPWARSAATAPRTFSHFARFSGVSAAPVGHRRFFRASSRHSRRSFPWWESSEHPR